MRNTDGDEQKQTTYDDWFIDSKPVIDMLAQSLWIEIRRDDCAFVVADEFVYFPMGLLTLLALCVLISRKYEIDEVCPDAVRKLDTTASAAGAFFEARAEMRRVYPAFHTLPHYTFSRCHG